MLDRVHDTAESRWEVETGPLNKSCLLSTTGYQGHLLSIEPQAKPSGKAQSFWWRLPQSIHIDSSLISNTAQLMRCHTFDLLQGEQRGDWYMTLVGVCIHTCAFVCSKQRNERERSTKVMYVKMFVTKMYMLTTESTQLHRHFLWLDMFSACMDSYSPAALFATHHLTSSPLLLSFFLIAGRQLISALSAGWFRFTAAAVLSRKVE